MHVRSLGIQALGDVRGQFIALYGYHATQRLRRIEQCFWQIAEQVVAQVYMFQHPQPFQPCRHPQQAAAEQPQVTQAGQLVESKADRTQRVLTQVKRSQLG
ncbi:hypothetical protein D3C76_970530 [compost metagenome]